MNELLMSGIRVAWMDVPHDEAALFRALPVEKGYAPQVQAFQSPSRRLEWLGTRVLLHALLGREASLDHEPSGKPFLVDDSRYISISHSAGRVALGMGEFPFGLDIEQRDDKALRLSARFLAHGEWESLPDDWSEVDRATLAWSAKEAVFKLIPSPSPKFQTDYALRSVAPGLLFCRTKGTDEELAVDYLLLGSYVLTLAHAPHRALRKPPLQKAK